MMRLRLVLFFAVATLAFTDAQNATHSMTSTSSPSTSSILSTPSSLPDLSTDVVLAPLPEETTPPLCRCQMNDALQQNELVCASNDVDVDVVEQVELGAILSWDCQFVKIDVSSLDLTSIVQDAFDSRPDLQVVYLHSDFIEHVDSEAFRGLAALVDVDLSDNSLLTVDPRLFAYNSHLTSVSLADNALVELKSNAPILESASITHLDLSFCRITALAQESFSKLPKLQRLDLSSNNIQQLPVAALQSLPQLNALNIGNNRWQCDCAFKKVLEFARTMEETDSKVRCYGPDRVMEYWSETTALKYCPDPVMAEISNANNDFVAGASEDYGDSSSEEYDEEYEIIETPHTNVDADDDADDGADDGADLMQSVDDLQVDTKDLRQAMSALVDADVVTEDVDETQDVDEDGEEVIIVLEGNDSEASEADTDVVSAAVLVFVLAALIAFGVGIGVAVCRALVRRDHGSQGWSELNEEGGSDVHYKKVPLE